MRRLVSWLRSWGAVALAALVEAACGVPDIAFYDGGVSGAEASQPGVDAGALDAQALDDGSADASPDAGAATCPSVPPLGATACCDAGPCSGQCDGNCGLCVTAGCGASELCCVHSHNAVCRPLGSGCP